MEEIHESSEKTIVNVYEKNTKIITQGQGPPGAAGASYNSRGDWSSVTTYYKLDTVRYNHATWVSKVDNNTNHAPSEVSSWWQLVSKDGGVTINVDTGNAIYAQPIETILDTPKSNASMPGAYVWQNANCTGAINVDEDWAEDFATTVGDPWTASGTYPFGRFDLNNLSNYDSLGSIDLISSRVFKHAGVFWRCGYRTCHYYDTGTSSWVDINTKTGVATTSRIAVDVIPGADADHIYIAYTGGSSSTPAVLRSQGGFEIRCYNISNMSSWTLDGYVGDVSTIYFYSTSGIQAGYGGYPPNITLLPNGNFYITNSSYSNLAGNSHRIHTKDLAFVSPATAPTTRRNLYGSNSSPTPPTAAANEALQAGYNNSIQDFTADATANSLGLLVPVSETTNKCVFFNGFSGNGVFGWGTGEIMDNLGASNSRNAYTVNVNNDGSGKTVNVFNNVFPANYSDGRPVSARPMDSNIYSNFGSSVKGGIATSGVWSGGDTCIFSGHVRGDYSQIGGSSSDFYPALFQLDFTNASAVAFSVLWWSNSKTTTDQNGANTGSVQYRASASPNVGGIGQLKYYPDTNQLAWISRYSTTGFTNKLHLLVADLSLI